MACDARFTGPVARPLVPVIRWAPRRHTPPRPVHAVLPHTTYRRAFGLSRHGLLALSAMTIPVRQLKPTVVDRLVGKHRPATAVAALVALTDEQRQPISGGLLAFRRRIAEWS
jgi:hypothetical protein